MRLKGHSLIPSWCTTK